MRFLQLQNKLIPHYEKALGNLPNTTERNTFLRRFVQEWRYGKIESLYFVTLLKLLVGHVPQWIYIERE